MKLPPLSQTYDYQLMYFYKIKIQIRLSNSYYKGFSSFSLVAVKYRHDGAKYWNKKANQYYGYPFDYKNTMTIRMLARHTVSSSIPYDSVCARTSARRLLRVQPSPQECSVSQSGSTIEV